MFKGREYTHLKEHRKNKSTIWRKKILSNLTQLSTKDPWIVDWKYIKFYEIEGYIFLQERISAKMEKHIQDQ